MSESASGVVKYVGPNDYGFYRFKLDNDEWYNTGSKKDPGFEKGDKVKFSYYLKDDKYATVKGKVTKIGKGSVSSGKSSGQSSQLSKEEWAAKDAKAERGYAIIRAIEFLTLANSAGALGFLEKAKKPADKYDLLQQAVTDLADKFVAYASGPKDKPAPKDDDEEGNDGSEESEDEESDEDEDEDEME